MESWKQYLLSILVCSGICAILSQMVSDTRGKKRMQFLCGIVLTITVLSPLSGINIDDYLKIPDMDCSASDVYIRVGKMAASQEQERFIKACCEAYILERAKELDVEMAVQISLDAQLVPVFAQIQCTGDPNLQTQLEHVITMDLGIPKENQKWTWNRENNSS